MKNATRAIFVVLCVTGCVILTGPGCGQNTPAGAKDANKPAPATSAADGAGPAPAPAPAAIAKPATPEMAAKVGDIFWWARLYYLGDRYNRGLDLGSLSPDNLPAMTVALFSITPDELQPAMAEQLKRADARFAALVLPVAVNPHFRFGEAAMYASGDEAVKLLGMLGDRSAVPPLLSELSAGSGMTRAVAKALDRLDPAWRKSDAARKMVAPLIQAAASGKLPPDLPGRWIRYQVDPPQERLEMLTSDLVHDAQFDAPPPDMEASMEARERFREQLLSAYRAGIVRKAAAEALPHLLAGQDAKAAAPAVQALTAALREELSRPFHPWKSREHPALTVCQSLNKLDPKWHQAPQVQALVRTLLARTKQYHEEIARAIKEKGYITSDATKCGATNYLEWIGAPQAAGPLLEQITAGNCYPPGMRDVLEVLSGRSFRGDGDLTLPSRSDLVDAMLACADESLMPAVRELAKSQDSGRLALAALLLGKLGGPESVSALAALLDDEQAAPAAVLAMAQTGRKEAVAPLIRAAGAATGNAADAFDRLPEDEKQRLIRRYGSRDEAVAAIPNRAPAGREGPRILAILALGRIGGSDALAALLKAARQSGDKAFAVEALAATRDPAAAPALLEALCDTDMGIRSAAAKGLARMNEQKAVEPLLAWLKQALGEDRGSGQMTRSRYYNSDPERSLFKALAALRARQAIAPLTLEVARNNKEALNALMAIDAKWQASSEARQALPQLAAVFDANSPEDMLPSRLLAAVILIGAIGDRQSLPLAAGLIGRSGVTEELAAALARLDPAWPTAPAVLARADGLLAMVKDYRPPAPKDFEKASYDQQRAEILRQSRLIDCTAEAAWFLGMMQYKPAEQVLMDCLERLAKEQTAGKGDDDPFPSRRGQARLPYQRIQSACADALARLKSRRAVDIMRS